MRRKLFYILIGLFLPCLAYSNITDTIPVNMGKNYILLQQDVLECKLSNPGYSYKILNNLLEVDASNNQDCLMLVCCKNNQNSLIYLNHNTSEVFTDARTILHSFPEVSNLEYRLNLNYNKQIRFNSSTALEKLHEVISQSKTSSLVSYNKTNKLELLLFNQEQDYQLKYYALAISNKSKENFVPGLIEIYQEDKMTLIDILPVVKTELGCIGNKSRKVFGFALSKKIEGNFFVRIKDKYNHNKSIKLEITNN